MAKEMYRSVRENFFIPDILYNRISGNRFRYNLIKNFYSFARPSFPGYFIAGFPYLKLLFSGDNEMKVLCAVDDRRYSLHQFIPNLEILGI